MCDIIELLTGIVGVLISIIAIFISISTARRQVKLDLYNKRYQFYVACDIICVSCIMEKFDLISKRLEMFNINLDHYSFCSSEFLFDKATYELIMSVYEKTSCFQDICYTISKLDKDDNKDEELYTRLQNDKKEYLSFFYNARKELKDRFNKYLQVNQ